MVRRHKKKSYVSRMDQPLNKIPIKTTTTTTPSLIFRPKTPNLHTSLPRPPTHNSTNIPPITNFPNRITTLRQLSHIIPRLSLKQPHPTIVPSRHHEPRIELERGHRGFVGGKTV